MSNPEIDQANLPNPSDAVDAQVMAFNSNTGQPYDPNGPSSAEAGITVGIKLDTPVI